MEISINGLIADFCRSADWQIVRCIQAEKRIDVPLWQEPHKNDTDRAATTNVAIQLQAHQTNLWAYGVVNGERLVRVFVSKMPYPAPALNLAYMPDINLAAVASAKLNRLYAKYLHTELATLG